MVRSRSSQDRLSPSAVSYRLVNPASGVFYEGYRDLVRPFLFINGIKGDRADDQFIHALIHLFFKIQIVIIGRCYIPDVLIVGVRKTGSESGSGIRTAEIMGIIITREMRTSLYFSGNLYDFSVPSSQSFLDSLHSVFLRRAVSAFFLKNIAEIMRILVACQFSPISVIFLFRTAQKLLGHFHSLLRQIFRKGLPGLLGKD